MQKELTDYDPVDQKTRKPGIKHLMCSCQVDAQTFIALCGEYVTKKGTSGDNHYGQSCVICEDLDPLPCKVCGL